MNIIQFRFIQKIILLLKPHFKWFLLIAMLYTLTGCQAIQMYPRDINLLNWKYADIRILDPIDGDKQTQDLMAVYSRINYQSVQLRIDLLSMPIAGEQDFYILFDTNPGGSPNVITDSGQDFTADFNWDYLIKIPGKGDVSIYNDHYLTIDGIALLIVRDPSLESILLNFNKNKLPITLSKTFLQVFITAPGTSLISDKTEAFSMDAPSPAVGKALFVFWNTFSSASPAQALRSWSGAHAGPVSSRHGLKYILEAAYRTKTPIVLSDLFTPENLSALDYLGALPEITKLINYSIIFPLDKDVIKESKNFLYRFKNVNLYNKFLIISVGDNDYAKLSEINKCLQLSGELNRLYDPNDFLIECKSLLLQNALEHPTLPMIMGGDFSQSLLGDPNISKEFFGYISTHPWIQVITDANIADNNYSTNNSANMPERNVANALDLPAAVEEQFNIINIISKSLVDLPENEITNLAKDLYQSLLKPAPQELQNIKLNYIGQLGILIKASKWSNNPTNMMNCDSDLDYDGINECVLANSKYFLVVEPNGGYIPFVFSVDTRGVHQIIGPTWEFLVGISDSSEWDNSRGVRSDPGQILGAFADNIREWNNYNADIVNNEIVLVSSDMSMRKSIIMSQDSLRVDINSTSLKNSYFYIPLVVDPWVRYSPDWGDLYFGDNSPNSVNWGIADGQTVQISTAMKMNFYAFNDTRTMIRFDENPNFDYTRGHYLPFPMSLVELTPSDDISVSITIK